MTADNLDLVAHDFESKETWHETIPGNSYGIGCPITNDLINFI